MRGKKGKPCPREDGRSGPLVEEVRTHTKAIREIRVRTTNVETNLDFILNKVSANGRPGLENSLKDIHGGMMGIEKTLREVLDATESSRAWSNVRKSVGNLMKKSVTGKIISTPLGRVAFFVVNLLLTNTVLHALGVNLNVSDILQYVGLIK